MKIVLFWLFLCLGFSAGAIQLEYLNQVVLPHKMKFEKSRIGGLSGIHFDSAQQILYAVSDDRGLIDEPRIYGFKMQISLKEFKVTPASVTFLSVNESQASHQSTKSSSRLFSKVLDLEGLAMTPWGDFLLSNEGDQNKKPRVMPQLISAQKDGTLAKEFPLPEHFLPESSGEQRKGVRNNFGFEGLAGHPNGKEWMLACEGPLVQDKKNFVRFVKYEMPEAWNLKPVGEYRYPLVTTSPQPSDSLEFQKGVSEVAYWGDHSLLVLERVVQLGAKGLKLQVQLYVTDLPPQPSSNLLTKRMLLDLSSLEEKIGKVGNFEGMTWGPTLSDSRKSLILVSDDNFMRDQRTQFLLFAVKE